MTKNSWYSLCRLSPSLASLLLHLRAHKLSTGKDLCMSAKHITPRANKILQAAETLNVGVKIPLEHKNAEAHLWLTRAKTAIEKSKAAYGGTISTVESQSSERQTSVAEKVTKVPIQTVLVNIRTRVKTSNPTYERKKWVTSLEVPRFCWLSTPYHILIKSSRRTHHEANSF